ncbi:MAG: hypothetical protein KHZ65_09080 [Phocaeicola vulgatus]|nr:hypothetical protein [Phocaeicola vulgatus]
MSNNENSVIEYLKTNNEVLFDKIVNALRKGKQVNFTDINQSDIIILSPQKAFEYAGEEGDKYFKVWMVGSRMLRQEMKIKEIIRTFWVMNLMFLPI